MIKTKLFKGRFDIKSTKKYSVTEVKRKPLTMKVVFPQAKNTYLLLIYRYIKSLNKTCTAYVPCFEVKVK